MEQVYESLSTASALLPSLVVEPPIPATPSFRRLCGASHQLKSLSGDSIQPTSVWHSGDVINLRTNKS